MNQISGAYPGETYTETRPADFWPRAGGYIIDAIVLGVVQVILSLALGRQTLLYSLVILVVDVGYFLYFWSTTGQTLGDKAVGVRVVREDGQPMTLGRAAVRYLGLIVSTIPLFLGLLWVIWDSKKQGWHDKMASTLVLKV